MSKSHVCAQTTPPPSVKLAPLSLFGATVPAVVPPGACAVHAIPLAEQTSPPVTTSPARHGVQLPKKIPDLLRRLIRHEAACACAPMLLICNLSMSVAR